MHIYAHICLFVLHRCVDSLLFSMVKSTAVFISCNAQKFSELSSSCFLCPFCMFSLIFLTEQLIYNVLVSGAQRVIQLYILFSNYFPSQNITKYQIRFPALCSRFLFSSSFVFLNRFLHLGTEICLTKSVCILVFCLSQPWSRPLQHVLTDTECDMGTHCYHTCVRSPQFMLTLLTSIQGLERLP